MPSMQTAMSSAGVRTTPARYQDILPQVASLQSAWAQSIRAPLMQMATSSAGVRTSMDNPRLPLMERSFLSVRVITTLADCARTTCWSAGDASRQWLAARRRPCNPRLRQAQRQLHPRPQPSQTAFGLLGGILDQAYIARCLLTRIEAVPGDASVI